MNSQKASTKNRTIRILWMAVAATSGFVQLLLIMLGAMHLSELYDWKWIGLVTLVAPFWSLFWPIFGYVGMNEGYRELLNEQRLRKRAEIGKSPIRNSGSN